MPASEAQILANRKNALKSTGPKTPEGKARSRCNALKHGLTGEGVALSNEDQVEIGKRYDDLSREMRPSSAASAALLRRFAFMTVRIERCERNDNAVLSKKVRDAVEQYDDARLAAVEALGARLYTEPATSVRRLQMTPEGIDWLLNEWSILRADLNHEEGNRWTTNHRSRFDSLLGLNPGGYRIGRIMALSEAVLGGLYHLDKGDGEGLEGPARSAWAKVELTRLLDLEVDRLKAARASFDHERLALDRAEAPDRALFDPSPEMTLARKYEAATERAMYKALKEFHQAEAAPSRQTEAPEVEEPGSFEQGPIEEPASSEPEPSDEAAEAEPDDEIVPPSPPRYSFSDSSPVEPVAIHLPTISEPPDR